MPRPCSICEHKARYGIDRMLLEMPVSKTTYRGISRRYHVSEDSLQRHHKNHVIPDQADVMQIMEESRKTALAEIGKAEKEQTIASVKTDIATTTAGRLRNAAGLLQKMRILQTTAATLLDQAIASDDLRSAGTFLRELREQLKLWAELTGKLQSVQQFNQFNRLDINNLSGEQLDRRIHELYHQLYDEPEMPGGKIKKTTLEEARIGIMIMKQKELAAAKEAISEE